MKPRKFHTFWGIFSLILGLFITLQIKSVAMEAKLNNTQKDTANLEQRIKEEQVRNASLESQVKGYESNIETLEKKVTDNKDAAEVERARMLAGLTDVKGNGIIITLNDSQKSLNQLMGLQDLKDLVIHEWQLIDLVDLLRASGAEAISLNEERIISKSEIQCAGPTVSVNHTRYAVPFEIKVIGNPDQLQQALDGWDVFARMKSDGLEVQYKKVNDIFIPKYRELFTDGKIMEEVGVKS